MAVFTSVDSNDAAALCAELGLGPVRSLEGIAGGIENTNYFLTTGSDEQPRAWVLTLFERLSAEQLPFYLQLMHHLAEQGLPVPKPVANAKGELLHALAGKPAAVVNRLPGQSNLQPQVAHVATMGAVLAKLHVAGASFALQQPNLRALPWWNDTAPLVLPHLNEAQAALLRHELAYQNHVAATGAYRGLPRGAVHADLFRDNVLFDGTTLTGVFDFYFAGTDTWLFDLAVCANDWCNGEDGVTPDPIKLQAMLQAYQATCPFGSAERRLWPAMQRAAALRFWISRLWDFYLPREAALLTPHDPKPLEQRLRARVAAAQATYQETACI